MADAFAPIEAKYYNEVMANTFGHLAPEPNTKHNVSILFCWGDYGDIIPIKMESTTLEDSPWFYDHMQTFIEDNAKEQGRVYRFEGTYQMFKNGNCRFSGKTTVVV
jgi:hypothetical protein